VTTLPVRPAATAGPLPAALTGVLVGDAVVRMPLTGTKGQRLAAELQARRLGATVDPVLELYDANRRLVAAAVGRPVLGGDARLTATLPADGPYTLELHDLLFRAPATPFVLEVGDLAFADHPFPLAARTGTKSPLRLLGTVPADAPPVPVDLTGVGEDVAVTLPRRPGLAGPGPRLVVSPDPEAAETPPAAGKLQELTAPAGVSGVLATAGEEDRYRFAVTPGKWRVEVTADRLGSPVDPVLAVTAEGDGQLLSADDLPDSADAAGNIAVPPKVKAVVVAVRDLAGRGGPDFVYRVAVTPLSRDDFTLTVASDTVTVPAGGTATVKVGVRRRGFNGAVLLEWQGLPAGVTATPAEVPAGVNDILVSLAAPPGQGAAQGLGRLVGRSGSTVRTAAAGAGPAPWLRRDLGLAVVAAGPLRVAWSGGEPTLSLGGKASAAVTVERSPGVTGAVRLTLVTNQDVPQTADKKGPDVNKALRLEGTPQVAAGQTSAPLTVLVPGDLPKQPYDLVVRAELLGADGKTVVASADTPVRRATPAAAAAPPAKK
jgi:hypothetical protein